MLLIWLSLLIGMKTESISTCLACTEGSENFCLDCLQILLFNMNGFICSTSQFTVSLAVIAPLNWPQTRNLMTLVESKNVEFISPYPMNTPKLQLAFDKLSSTITWRLAEVFVVFFFAFLLPLCIFGPQNDLSMSWLWNHMLFSTLKFEPFKVPSFGNR